MPEFADLVASYLAKCPTSALRLRPPGSAFVAGGADGSRRELRHSIALQDSEWTLLTRKRAAVFAGIRAVFGHWEEL